MKRIGTTSGVAIFFGAVVALGEVLEVSLFADGESARLEAGEWHRSVDDSVAQSKRAGPVPTFPDAPGDAFLVDLRPQVEVDGVQLNLVDSNFLTVSGIDLPWEARWRFALPEESRESDSAVVSISVPAIDSSVQVHTSMLREHAVDD